MTNEKIIIVVALLAIVAFGAYFVGQGNADQDLSQGGREDSGPVKIPSQGVNCPTDGDTSVALDVVNVLNPTTSEGVDVTARLYEVNPDGTESFAVKVTDTTSPTASTIDCGKMYVVKLESTDGASGDNSVFKVIKSAPEGSYIKNGDLYFLADDGNVPLEVGIEQQATLQGNMYNNKVRAAMYDTGDADSSDYETDGVTFSSTTNNATATAVGSGGLLDMTLTVQAVQTDTNWNDRGTWILIDATSSVWDTDNALLTVNGETLTDATEEMTKQEKDAWSGYELAFLYDGDITNIKEAAIRLKMNADSGVDPGSSDDVQIDIGARGSYLKTASSNSLAVGGVKDDSSATVVRTIYDTTVDIS
ncbi:MAG: hypothetical protein WC483_02970 [Candidatus Paceibacterota bacterium]